VKRRWLPLAAVAVAVTLAHLWLADGVLQDRLGSGAASGMTRRIEVAFVRELQPVAPVAVVAALPPPRRPRRATAPERLASQPEADASALASAPASAPDPLPPSALQRETVAQAPVDAASSPLPAPSASTPEAGAAAVATVEAAAAESVPPESGAAPFDWPPSTRLSYTVTGYFRGPVDGQARVEWLRRDGRYQVHLDVSIGPSFAPLVARRMSSEGEITEAGLRPRRYEEETRIALRPPRQATILFGDDRIRLPSGQDLSLPAGVQDSASQFVQMTWMFTLQPSLLEPGRTVELPLALPRRVEPWIYDVLARETLYTPMGEVPAVHVKPRREARPGGDLTAEFWAAPSLQYLPVRIVIRQDAENFIDLLIDRLPQQAAATAVVPAPVPASPPALTSR